MRRALQMLVLLAVAAPAAGGKEAPQPPWKGQYKVEHCFRLTNQLFRVGPMFLKKPQRIVSLIFLIMVGSLVAGLIERQVRRVLAERQQPIRGLMPEGRDNLTPTVPRILKAFGHYSIVLVRRADGSLLDSQFAKLDAVQQRILNVLGFPCPAELFGRTATS